MARRITKAEQKAIERQRRGKGLGVLPVEQSVTTKRAYNTSNRPRVTTKASGARGWYASTEWKKRSRAQLQANPLCIVCGGKATIADHIEWAHPDDREAVLEGALQSMCFADHQQKSCDDQARRAGRKPRPIRRRTEIDPSTGLPLPGQPWHPWSEPE
jgi:hypothetical protein